VTLSRGEALYLPAGNIHAYLDGLGVELMAASDNVLRGGLTPKHIDVPELLGVLDFSPVPVPYLRGVVPGAAASAVSSAAAWAVSSAAPGSSASGVTSASPASGIEIFVPDVPDFVLVHVSGTDLDAGYTLTGPGIAICTSGSISLEGAASSVTVGRGESVYVTPDEASLRFTGSGELFLATTGE
jgi:mannose-6-phosphate isomerase